MQDPLIAAAPETNLQTPLLLQERPVDQYIDAFQQRSLGGSATQQRFQRIAGVGGYLVASGLQEPRKGREAFRLGEGLAAGKGHTPAKGIGSNDLQDILFGHLRAAAEFPCFGIMAAGAVMGTTLREDGGADTGPVYNAVTDDAGKIKHPCSYRA